MGFRPFARNYGQNPWPMKNKDSEPQPNNPLHGITLAMILEHLVAYYGWEKLGQTINIRCFQFDPSIRSSLTFLRKTPWARQQVEQLYLATVGKA
jgi:uncharacterized protein (DUF2132 family)